MFSPFCLPVRHFRGTCCFLSQIFKFVSDTTNSSKIDWFSDSYMYSLMSYHKRRTHFVGVQAQTDKKNTYMSLVKITKEEISKICNAMQESLWCLP